MVSLKTSWLSSQTTFFHDNSLSVWLGNGYDNTDMLLLLLRDLQHTQN